MFVKLDYTYDGHICKAFFILNIPSLRRDYIKLPVPFQREKFSHAQSVMIMQSASMEVVFAKLDTLEMGILARVN